MLTEKYSEEIESILKKYPPDQKRAAVLPLLYLAQREGGKYRIQVCTDLPCALRGAEECLEKLCENLGIRVGETTPDGLVTIEKVMCLAGCDKAPLFQVQTSEGIEYHENQSVEKAMDLIDKWKKRR